MGMSELVDRHRSVVAPVIGFDNDVEMVSGQGAWLTGVDGRRYLDFATGIAVTNAGHSHPKIVAAARDQLDRFWHGGGTFRYESVVALAERLVDLAPPPIDMFFFMNSGSEAVEAAVKLARHTTGRQAVVVFRGGFHGRTMGAVSYTTSTVKYRRGYSPLLPSVYVTAFPHPFRWGMSPEAAAERALMELRRLFRHEVPAEEVACFLIEPVQGEGGYYPAPPLFLEGIREIADNAGIALVVDEVQTGFGRTASWWALDHYPGVVPDILVLGKAIANGFPLSAVGSTKDRFGKWPTGSHGTTFGGNPVACAAAVATTEVITEFLPHSRQLSEHAFRRLSELKQRHPTIGDVRGLGLMIGVELVEEGRKPNPRALEAVRADCAESGLLFHPCGPEQNIIRFVPPLVITLDELEQGIEIIDKAIAAYESA